MKDICVETADQVWTQIKQTRYNMFISKLKLSDANNISQTFKQF